jgi:hypothetical protein
MVCSLRQLSNGEESFIVPRWDPAFAQQKLLPTVICHIFGSLETMLLLIHHPPSCPVSFGSPSICILPSALPCHAHKIRLCHQLANSFIIELPQLAHASFLSFSLPLTPPATKTNGAFVLPIKASKTTGKIAKQINGRPSSYRTRGP